MKFAEHLLAHITPEWRRQYIVYEDMKTMLYEAVENLPTIETTDSQEIDRLIRAFDEDFLAFCEKELFKINVFYEEKLAEAKRKFDALRKEMDALALENNQSSRSKSSSAAASPLTRLVNVSLLPETTSASAKTPLNLRQRSSLSAAMQGVTSSQLRQSMITKQQLKSHHSSPTTSSKPAQQQQQQVVAPTSSSPLTKHPHAHQSSSQYNTNNNNNQKQQYQLARTGTTNYGTLSMAPGIDRKKLNDLKLAFSEFYLSLVLLQNYQRLNFTGFRKIFKKHDKLIGNEEGKRWHHLHVECAFFHTNKDVDKLIEDTENIVTYQLESGDRQKAMKRLRVPPLNDAPQPWTAFRVGFSLGAFLVLAIAVALTGIFQQTGDDWRIVFRLYRSSLFIIFFIFLVGINIFGWRAHGVNHVLIFELDPRDHLGSQDLLEISFTFGLLWCISVLLFLWSQAIGIPPLLNPMILNGILLIYLFNPTRTFHYSARYWLIGCIVSITVFQIINSSSYQTNNHKF